MYSINVDGVIITSMNWKWNDTIYRLGHGEKGSLTSFCSPIPHSLISRGSYPDVSMPLIKRVMGVAGDLVTATDPGIEINGLPVSKSMPLDLGTNGIALRHLKMF